MSTQLNPEISTSSDEEVRPQLGSISLWVSNFEAMRHFYSEVMGFPEAWVGNVVYNCAVYDFNGYQIILCHNETFTPPQRGWTRCPAMGSEGENWDPYITFYVPDIQAVIDRCRAAGAILRTPEPFSLGGNFGVSIEVKDPDGNAIAITQRGISQKEVMEEVVGSSESVIPTAQSALVQVRNLGMLTIHVSDLERSIKFYREMFGFEKEQEQMLSPAVAMRVADVQIYLNPGCDNMERREGNCPEISLALVVHGVRATGARLRDAGVKIIGDYYEMSPAFASIQVGDPDGNMIELLGKP